MTGFRLNVVLRQESLIWVYAWLRVQSLRCVLEWKATESFNDNAFEYRFRGLCRGLYCSQKLAANSKLYLRAPKINNAKKTAFPR